MTSAIFVGRRRLALTAQKGKTGEPMKSLKVIFVFSLSGALAACGGGGKTTDQQEVTDAYEFIENGCSTGVHKFSGNSVDDVKRAYCETLRDDEANRYCAATLRFMKYSEKCVIAIDPSPTPSPTPLAPVVQPTPVPTARPPADVTPQPATPQPATPQPAATPELIPISKSKSASIRYSLANFVASAVQVQPQAAHLPVVLQYVDEAQSCGLKLTRTGCLSRDLDINAWAINPVSMNGQIYVAAKLPLANQSQPLLQILEVTMGDHDFVESYLAKIYFLNPYDAASSIENLLREFANKTPLAVVHLTMPNEHDTLQGLKAPKNHRHLFHLGKKATIMAGDSGPLVQETIEAIGRNTTRILASGESNYQKAYLVWLADAKWMPAANLSAFAEASLSVVADEVRQLAASVLAEKYPSRVDLKPLIHSAMDNQDYKIRERGVRALSSMAKSHDDKLKLIQSIGDSDSDIQKLAINACSQFQMTKEFLTVLIGVGNSSSWTARAASVDFISKIPGEEATSAILEKLGDSDGDVRKAAMKAAASRSLSLEHLVILRPHMSSSDWQVRRAAISQISRIAGDSATQLLLQGLGDDDGDVRGLAVKALLKREAKESEYDLLQAHLQSDNWQVRREAVKRMNLLPGKVVTRSLIAALDESDADVLKALGEALESRPISAEFLSDLTKAMESDDWRSRVVTVSLIARIPGESAKAALVKATSDSDRDVQRAAEAALKKRKK